MQEIYAQLSIARQECVIIRGHNEVVANPNWDIFDITFCLGCNLYTMCKLGKKDHEKKGE